MDFQTTIQKRMSIPKPPFHSTIEELLYNIYLKFPEMGSMTTNDINTLAKLNAILTDGDLMKSEDIMTAINETKGNVPVVANTLEKLYNIIQALNFLKAEDIDTLAELNAIISDADVVKNSDLTGAIANVKGNVPLAGDTLEKLYNLIQSLNYLKAEDIDTLAELNALLVDADVVKTEDLTSAINGLKGNVPVVADTLEKLYALVLDGSKKRIVSFFFESNLFTEQAVAFRGKLNALSQDITDELASVTYESRLDAVGFWTPHADLVSLQNWINANSNGNEATGSKFWIKCLATYKVGRVGEAENIFSYTVL
jgi:hypothetical protein